MEFAVGMSGELALALILTDGDESEALMLLNHLADQKPHHTYIDILDQFKTALMVVRMKESSDG